MEGHNIGQEIQGLVRALERDNPGFSMGVRIKKAWNLTIEPQQQKHITGVFIVPNTQASEVIVYVDDPVVAADMSMQTEFLRLKMNLKLSEGENPPQVEKQAEQIKKLQFKVSKDTYSSKKHDISTYQELKEEEDAYKNIQPIKLNEDELSTLQQAVAQIENDELREIAYSAAILNLEWNKGLEAQKQKGVQ